MSATTVLSSLWLRKRRFAVARAISDRSGRLGSDVALKFIEQRVVVAL
jgi:hypothetical protein